MTNILLHFLKLSILFWLEENLIAHLQTSSPSWLSTNHAQNIEQICSSSNVIHHHTFSSFRCVGFTISTPTLSNFENDEERKSMNESEFLGGKRSSSCRWNQKQHESFYWSSHGENRHLVALQIVFLYSVFNSIVLKRCYTFHAVHERIILLKPTRFVCVSRARYTSLTMVFVRCCLFSFSRLHIDT